jgi:hypothetical protein
MFLIVTLAAVCVSHVRTSWLLNEARQEAEWLESARLESSWPTPNAVNAVALKSPGGLFNPSSGTAIMRWKLQLPPDRRFTLHIGSSSSLPAGTDVRKLTASSTSIQLGDVLQYGISELMVTIQQGRNAKLRVSWDVGAGKSTTDIDDVIGLFSMAGYENRFAGLKYTQSGNADEPFELACVHESSRGAPAPGLILWMEPVSDTMSDATEQKDARETSAGSVPNGESTSRSP